MKLQEEGKIGSVMYDEAQFPGDKVTGLGGKNVLEVIGKGVGFVLRMLSKKGREKDVHARAARDKDYETTNRVINALRDNQIF